MSGQLLYDWPLRFLNISNIYSKIQVKTKTLHGAAVPLANDYKPAHPNGRVLASQRLRFAKGRFLDNPLPTDMTHQMTRVDARSGPGNHEMHIC